MKLKAAPTEALCLTNKQQRHHKTKTTPYLHFSEHTRAMTPLWLWWMKSTLHLSETPTIFISFPEVPMMSNCLPNQMSLPLSAGSQYLGSAVAVQAAEQAAAQEQLTEKAQENKMMMVGEDQQRLIQHVLQQNLLAMATQLPLKIKLNNRGELLFLFTVRQRVGKSDSTEKLNNRWLVLHRCNILFCQYICTDAI